MVQREQPPVQVPAVVAAGDGRAARAVYGESKVYLEVGGRPLVTHVVAALQRVPEVSEVWVVGDAERLEPIFGRDEIRRERVKPLHIVGQFRNLYENAWQTYRRLLPGAGPEGRDPGDDDLDVQVLYTSGDLPFVTPQEISQFIRRSQARGCDYALGVVTEEAMEAFYPTPSGGEGIRMAYFNVREGRLRQSNLHLVRPARIINRTYIEEMYENRYQREFGSVVAMAWRLLRAGGFRVVAYYALMHLAGATDRLGLRRVSDRLRRWIALERTEAAVSMMLQTSFRFVPTDLGGAAVDIDNERDCDVARRRYDEWVKAQTGLAEALCGPLPLPPGEAPTAP
ncbi:MAG: nucleotidyltransferase family protein [Myxococcales bacterium]|nr:nucleotidyltransferase family protein [Myxococcales bacterium]